MLANKRPLTFILLASGAGTNAKALLEFSQRNPELVAPVALVSDRPNIGALDVAKEFGIPSFVVNHRKDHDILEILEKLQPEWALLAGYMRLVSPVFLSFFWDAKLNLSRVMNVHPSLLPAFPGVHAYEQAFEAGVQSSGVTIHIVDEGLDTGPILLQESFIREKGDNLESFESKGRALEYKLYTKALRLAAEGKLGEVLSD